MPSSHGKNTASHGKINNNSRYTESVFSACFHQKYQIKSNDDKATISRESLVRKTSVCGLESARVAFSQGYFKANN